MASLLPPIVSIWISTQQKKADQVPLDSIRSHLWDKYLLLYIISMSSFCQFVLLLFGKYRKKSEFLSWIVWVAYLASDWAANFALGIITSKVGHPIGSGEQDLGSDLLAFWSTFLLIHLGGPPTMIAEAIEDNALWLRNGSLSSVQTLRVIYIIYLGWRNTWFSCLSIGMLVVGFINCGMRACAQYCASTNNCHDLFSALDPSIHDMKFTQESPLTKSQHPTSEITTNESTNNNLQGSEKLSDTTLEEDRRVLFQNFKRYFVSLFTNVVMSSHDLRREQSNFQKLTAERAFEYVDVQLGYAYDVFYTKAYVMFSKWGIILDFCTFGITVAVLFCIVTKGIDMNDLLDMNQYVTLYLICVVSLVELYTLDEYLYSLWKKDFIGPSFFIRCIGTLYGKFVGYAMSRIMSNSSNDPEQPLLESMKVQVKDIYNIRLSKVISQYNLLSSFQDKDGVWKPIYLVEQLRETENSQFDKTLTENIFDHLKSKSSSAMPSKCGVNVAIEEEDSTPTWLEGTKTLEFHQSIITWHIATDLCYYGVDNIQDNEEGPPEVTISKTLSGYMMYLLVFQRHMLPIGRGMMVLRDTSEEAKVCFKQLNINLPLEDVRGACQKLLRDVNPKLKSRSHSALLDACRIAILLKESMHQKERRWKLLAKVWMEILAYAAAHSRADRHVQQLRKGGQFLTHVWLLMAHLGLMEQFQVPPTDNLSKEQSTIQFNEPGNGNTGRTYGGRIGED